LAWLADLRQMVYPHKWSPVSCRSSAGQGSSPIKVQRSTTVPCNQSAYSEFSVVYKTGRKEI